MAMQVVSYGGNLINDSTNFTARLLSPALGLPMVTPAILERTGNWPLAGAINFPPRILQVEITIRGASTDDLREDLHQWFDPFDGEAQQFQIENDNGSNDRYVNCVCIALDESPDGGGLIFVATLQIHGDVRWRGISAVSDTWNITASGQTKTLTNAGEDDAFPVFKIKPTSGKTGGYLYKRWIPIRWKSDVAATTYPMDIVNNGLDTATLVSGGKMQADGDDLRVFANGVEIDRWLDDINDATTKVWCNLNFTGKEEYTLKTAIAGAGSITSIEVNEDISGAPSTGILMIGTEAFVYTGKSEADKKFTGITREAKGTTIAAHSVNDVVWWVQNDVYIYYGDSSASAPTVDDDYKPAFNLTNSTNTSWDYDDFGDDNLKRAGGWVWVANTTPKGGGSLDQIKANQGDTSNDPWEEIGIRISTDELSAVGGSMRVFNACEITNAFFANGERYAADLSNWTAKIQSSNDGSNWTDEDDIAAPGSTSTWQSWSDNQIIDSGMTYVRLYLFCTFDWPGGSLQQLEAADVTLTLNSSNTPTLTINAEESNYSLEATITNNDTEESITVSFAMELNEEIEVDTDERTVEYLADDSNQFQALTINGGIRRDWLKLIAGDNELQFDDTGTNAVTLTTEYDQRHYS